MADTGVLPSGAHSAIGDSDKVKPILVDLGPEYDLVFTDTIQPLQQTLQWFSSQYGTLFRPRNVSLLIGTDEFFGEKGGKFPCSCDFRDI